MEYHQYPSTTTIGWTRHSSDSQASDASLMTSWYTTKQSRARLTRQEISTVMCRENITHNRSKWKFAQTTVDFAGFILSPKGYQIDPSITQGNHRIPYTSKPYWPSILHRPSESAVSKHSHHSNLLASLGPLLSTKNDYTWTKEFEAAFANVKKSLTAAPNLSYFDQDKETRLCTDASHQGLGFALQQKTGNTWMATHSQQPGSREHWTMHLTHLTYRLRCVRSMHIRISSVLFLGATTMGVHHLVGYDTGVIMPCSSKLWSFAFSFSLYAYDIVLGVLTQNGFASSMRAMWNCSPFMGFTLLSNMLGNSLIRFCEVTCWVVLDDEIVWTLMGCG